MYAIERTSSSFLLAKGSICYHGIKIFIAGQIDSNTDGLVDFEEFVAATLHVHQLVEHDTEKWKSLSQAAFDKFDVDGDGYITSDELRMQTGLKGSIDPLLEEADIDRDGKISLDEFRRLLKTASMSSRNVQTPRSVHRS
jgi:calcium-dependent protein kinase